MFQVNKKWSRNNLQRLGMAFETSKKSNLSSQFSMGSPEAYLIDSLSSIFLKPERKRKKLPITQGT
jgi:hypothetical protein